MFGLNLSATAHDDEHRKGHDGHAGDLLDAEFFVKQPCSLECGDGGYQIKQAGNFVDLAVLDEIVEQQDGAD